MLENLPVNVVTDHDESTPKFAGIRNYPEQGREALGHLDLAAAALVNFEKTIRYGAFRVKFTDEEQARALADYMHTSITRANAVPNIDLWMCSAFDTYEGVSEYISLQQFFKQKRRGRRFFKCVLKQHTRRLNDMRQYCVDQLAAAAAESESLMVSQIVRELNSKGQ